LNFPFIAHRSPQNEQKSQQNKKLPRPPYKPDSRHNILVTQL